MLKVSWDEGTETVTQSWAAIQTTPQKQVTKADGAKEDAAPKEMCWERHTHYTCGILASDTQPAPTQRGTGTEAVQRPATPLTRTPPSTRGKEEKRQVLRMQPCAMRKP